MMMENQEILFKEYDTLRAEVLAAMSNRNSVLTFGLATIGILYTAAAALIDKNREGFMLALIILAFVIPLACVFISYIWLGEYERMQRAGAFIMNLERRINAESGNSLLSWETHLREKKKKMRYPYKVTILFLMSLGIVSFAIGMFLGRNVSHCAWFYWSVLGIGVSVILSSFLHMLNQIKAASNNVG